MIKFKSRIVNNIIEEDETLESYIFNLYNNDNHLKLEDIEIPKGDDTPLYYEDLEWAKKKLCYDKAKGVDLMGDKLIHNPNIWSKVKVKILH